MTTGLDSRDRRITAPGVPAAAVGGGLVVATAASFFRVPLLPLLGAELSMSPSELGAVTAAFAGGRLAVDLPAGRLADRSAPLRLLAWSAMLLTVASGALAIAGSAAQVIAFSALLGVSTAVTNTTGMTVFASGSHPRRRGMAMAWYSATRQGGQALGPMLGGAIGAWLGWRAAFGTGGVIGLALVLGLLVADRRSSTVTPATAHSEHGRVSDDVRLGSLGGPAMLSLYAVPFASFFALGALPQTVVPLVGDAQYGLDAATIGAAIGFGSLFRFGGAFLGGRMSDRRSRRSALMTGLVVFAAGAGLLALGAGVASWVVAIALISFGSYVNAVAATVLGDVAEPGAAGRRLGVLRLAGDLGFVVGPLLAGVVYEGHGARPAALLVAVLLLAVTVLVAIVLPETRVHG